MKVSVFVLISGLQRPIYEKQLLFMVHQSIANQPKTSVYWPSCVLRNFWNRQNVHFSSFALLSNAAISTQTVQRRGVPFEMRSKLEQLADSLI